MTAVGPPPPGPVSGVLLGLGPAAQALAPPPSVGDTVTLAFDTTPAASSLLAAVGGGPLLVAGGAAGRRSVQSRAGRAQRAVSRSPGLRSRRDGTLLLIVADGRKPAVSIGLTRPEFGALMLGFGASDGLAFDSGGSATLVARELGTAGPSVLNDPSDGRERPVADALLAYSDAPGGCIRTSSCGRHRSPPIAARRSRCAAQSSTTAIIPLRAAEVAPLDTDPAPGPHVAIVRERGGTLTRRGAVSRPSIAWRR